MLQLLVDSVQEAVPEPDAVFSSELDQYVRFGGLAATGLSMREAAAPVLSMRGQTRFMKRLSSIKTKPRV